MEDLRLPASAAAAKAGRAFITGYCSRHGVSIVASDDAVLITSELIGNAYLHAGGGTNVSARCRGQVLRIEVTDGSTVHPQLRRGRTEDQNGRGVMIMDALAQDWGVHTQPTGKAVWFELVL